MCLTMAATAGARTQDSDKGEVEFLLNCAGCRRWKRLWPLSAKLDSKPTDLTLMAKHDHGTFDAGAIYQKIEGRNERASHHNAEMPIWVVPAPKFSASHAPVHHKPNQKYQKDFCRR